MKSENLLWKSTLKEASKKSLKLHDTDKRDLAHFIRHEGLRKQFEKRKLAYKYNLPLNCQVAP